jgi:hypothetical protein
MDTTTKAALIALCACARRALLMIAGGIDEFVKVLKAE